MNDALVVHIIELLHELAIPYMVTGSLASNYFGITRSTKDADILIQTDSASISALARRVKHPLHLNPQMSFESITGTSRYVVENKEGEYVIELFLLSDDPHDQERFKRRRNIPMQNQSVWVASPEDVIVTKLRWSKLGKRTKDVDDVRNVIAVQAETLDWEYIHRWCGVHGTRELLDEIRSTVPRLPKAGA